MGAIKHKFKDVSRIQHVCGDRELAEVIHMSHKNKYLLSDELTGPDRPLELLFTDECLGNEGTDSEHYIVQDEDDVIIAAASIQVTQDKVILGQISVHPDHRNQGYASALLESVMRRSLAEGKVLVRQGFTGMGAQYLAPMMQRLHPTLPDLRILYLGETPAAADALVDGHVLYTIVSASMGGATLQIAS